MSVPPLPPWRPKDAFNSGYHRRLHQAVNANAAIRGDNGIDVLSSPAGQSVVNTRERVFTDWFFGEILDTGPLGTEDDFTNNQYWVRRKRATVGAGQTVSSIETRQVDTEDDDAADGDKVATGSGDNVKDDTVIVATDVFDDDGARNYEAEQTVLILAVEGKVGDGVERAYVIIRPEAGGDTGIGFWFNISGVAAVGKYWAKAIVPLGTPIDPAADISFGSDFGLMPGDTVLLINAAELSNDTGIPWLSELMDDHIFFATPWGETNEDPPKGVWMIHGVHNGPCTA